MKGDDNPADLLTKHLNSEKIIRCLHFMSAEFREGRSPAAPQRKGDDKIQGEDMDWQIMDAVREEYDDDEAELRLVRECEEFEDQLDGLKGELQYMEEVHVAAEDCGDDTGTTYGTTNNGGRTLPWLQLA